MAKNTIKLTPTKAVIQVIDADATIALATDLLSAGQTVNGTPTVNITATVFSTPAASTISISRNSVKLLNLSNAGDFHYVYSLTANNTNDIVVTCPANCMVLLELSKVAGYSDVIPNVGA